MCGTLTRTITPDKIVAALGIKHVFNVLPPAFNIKPTMPVMIVREVEGERILDVYHWWLTPQWVKPKIEFKYDVNGRKTYKWKGPPISMFNLRHDTITDPEKPTWRKFLVNQRCGIVVDGFVEWPDDKLRDKKQDKIPALFSFKDREPFIMPGFWTTIQDDEKKDFSSCCLFTTEPNAMLKALPHHRMPAMLRGLEMDRWLSESLTDPLEAAALCHPTPDSEMIGHFITKAINKGNNNYPEMLKSVGEMEEDNVIVSRRILELESQN